MDFVHQGVLTWLRKRGCTFLKANNPEWIETPGGEQYRVRYHRAEGALSVKGIGLPTTAPERFDLGDPGLFAWLEKALCLTPRE